MSKILLNVRHVINTKLKKATIIQLRTSQRILVLSKDS